MVFWASLEARGNKMDWFTYMLILLGIIALAMLGFVLYKRTFKYKVILRELTGNGSMLINYDMAKSVIDKDSNTETWKLWYEKVTLTPPPSDAIEIDNRGRKFAELYKKGDYDFVWVVDNHTSASIEELMKKDAKTKGIKSEEAWKCVSASSKFAWLNQTKKAQEMKGKGIWDMIVQVAPFAMLGLILVVGYLMWDSQNEANVKTTKMLTDTVGALQVNLNAQTALTQKLLDKENNVQTLSSNGDRLPNATRIAPN